MVGLWGWFYLFFHKKEWPTVLPREIKEDELGERHKIQGIGVTWCQEVIKKKPNYIQSNLFKKAEDFIIKIGVA